MIITAKFASMCPCCSTRIASGSKVEWSKGSPARHVACARSAGNVDPSTRSTGNVDPSKRSTGNVQGRAGRTSHLRRTRSDDDPTVHVTESGRAWLEY